MCMLQSFFQHWQKIPTEINVVYSYLHRIGDVQPVVVVSFYATSAGDSKLSERCLSLYGCVRCCLNFLTDMRPLS